MTFIVNLIGKFMVLMDTRIIKNKKGNKINFYNKAVALIEYDYGLVRYILKILREFEISINENGYLQFPNKNGETYLHRIIIEYYSQFSDKLYTILKNPDYQVNHKNKLVWDNRLENLEMVTKLGQERHKRGLKYKDEIVFSTEELLELKNEILNKLNKNKKQNKDKKYLEKVNKYNSDYLTNGICRNKNKNKNINININKKYSKKVNKKNLYKLINEIFKYKNINKNKFFDNLYIKFRNNQIEGYSKKKMKIESINNNTLKIFTYIISETMKNTFFKIDNNYVDNNYFKYINDFYNIQVDYKDYRTINLLENNLYLLTKYYKKNKSFRDICEKYNLLNDKYLVKEYDSLNAKYIDRPKAIKTSKTSLIKPDPFLYHNILIDLFEIILSKTHNTTFYNNKLASILPVKDVIDTRGKYNSFRLMYLIDLLERTPTPDYNNKHRTYFNNYKPIPNSFFIPKYTDELFTSTILPEAKEFISKGFNKFTYSIIAKSYDTKTADKVYRSKSRRTKFIKKDFKSIEDIKDILINSSTLNTKLQQDGFINISDIVVELRKINEKRKNNNEAFIKKTEKDCQFVSGIIRNVIEIRDLLDKLNLKYIRLNSNTIENIKEYEKNKNSYSYRNLSYFQNRIVMKKLISVSKDEQKKNSHKNKK